MPGQASLRAAQYYANPRNAFWPIMLAIIQRGEPSPDAVQAMTYPQRCALLTDSGYALWDVLASCYRPGSLDSNIRRNSERPNDILALAERHQELRRIVCNGRTAEKLLQRHCAASLARLTTPGRQLELLCLPSTSPAMASLTLAGKHQRWAEGLLG
ncbi:MAG: DNA-deoxyinosine glycosylase [Granulosicoccus sp.]|nr:DNA-deoxyinosine glycosylase [Granulosicoccus sp.]